MKKLSLYPQKIEVELLTKNNVMHSLMFPATRIVCDRCNGTGSHTNPSIDGNGLSDDHVSDPDFMADYMAGSYDVRCTSCHGERIVDVIDDQFIEALEASHPRIFKAYWSRWQEIRDCESEMAAHKRSMDSGRGGW